MATPDTQVALSRIQRGASSGMSRATRQVVAPFLQKLYEMVSDSATDNLIRWSETGDTFFVLDHERVAHDVLPRWFKHSNFASFVRQLNMYGFHKIPHLQQGVLKSDTETELWNFEHPNFHRGQPDLLCLISRKKQAADRPNEDIALEPREAIGSPPTAINGSMLDVNNIVNGITAIKRHQAAISADLNDLKASNQHLWQEAIAARERHNKHQDTINKILKFLASVFGNAASPHKPPGENVSHPSIPRKRQRLMIEDGSKSGPEGMVPFFTESADHRVDFETGDDNLNTPTSRFATLDTPSSEAMAAQVSEPLGHETALNDTVLRSVLISPRAVNAPADASTSSKQTSAFLRSSPPPNAPTEEPFPSAEPSHGVLAPISQGSPNHSDAILQAILNSPQQLQKLFGVLNFQQGFPGGPSLDVPPQPTNPTPQSEASLFSHPSFSPASATVDLVEPLDDSPNYLSLLRNDDNSNFGPILDNTSKFHKSYKDATDINADVDALQSSIDALIENLGLNPSVSTPQPSIHGIHQEDDPVLSRDASRSSAGVFQGEEQSHVSDGGVPDFDVEAFFRELNRQNGEHPDADNDDTDVLLEGSNTSTISDQPSAFLDEVASQSDAATPAVIRSSLDDFPPTSEEHKSKQGIKRKTDDVVNNPTENGQLTTKPKRKR